MSTKLHTSNVKINILEVLCANYTMGWKNIYKHLALCQPTDNNSIKTEIITGDKDPINLRLKEAYHICNEQPSIHFCFILFYNWINSYRKTDRKHFIHFVKYQTPEFDMQCTYNSKVHSLKWCCITMEKHNLTSKRIRRCKSPCHNGIFNQLCNMF